MSGRRLKWPQRLALAAPYVWLAVFFAAPFAIIVRLSFSQSVLAQPPYAPQFDFGAGLADVLERVREFTVENYALFFSDALYAQSYASSVRIALLSTALSLAIAPFWTSFLIRVYGWIAILKDEGFLNASLKGLGLIDAPLQIFATEAAVVIGIAYSYLPFMVLPIFNALDRQDRSLVEAALDLGASRASAFWTVTFPLSLPGVFAGALLVFIPAVGEFVIPDLLGGSDTLMIGRTLWNEFFANRDWPVAAAAAILLLAALVAPLIFFERAQMRDEGRR